MQQCSWATGTSQLASVTRWRGAGRSARRPIVALLLFTGLRLSEAAALQAADVRISAREGLVVVRSGKGDAYPAVELNAVDEIIAVMRAAGAGPDAARLRALIVILWRAGFRPVRQAG